MACSTATMRPLLFVVLCAILWIADGVWTIDGYPNPMKDVDKCGRQKVWCCDLRCVAGPTGRSGWVVWFLCAGLGACLGSPATPLLTYTCYTSQTHVLRCTCHTSCTFDTCHTTPHTGYTRIY